MAKPSRYSPEVVNSSYVLIVALVAVMVVVLIALVIKKAAIEE